MVPAKPGVTVLVDYAHKPDALEAVLTALRRLRAGRIICVFGCGGDRDRGKRPIMGEIAGRLADIPVLTSDNPRSEDPMAIIAEVEKGLIAAGRARSSDTSKSGGYIVEPDRRAAIALALKIAAAGDAVLIAGKGHEDYQLVAGRVLPFDDRVVVREIAAELSRGQRLRFGERRDALPAALSTAQILSGFNVLRYETLRSVLAGLAALALSLALGPVLIDRFRALHIGQTIREEVPQAHQKKAGTPTMGGLLIVASMLCGDAAARQHPRIRTSGSRFS